MIETARTPTTVVSLLATRAAETPDRIAYHFVPDEGAAADLTYAELSRRVSGLANWLSRVAQSGDRALLLYPAGLDFVSSFYACLASGVVAVPAPPPDPERVARYLPRIEAVAADAGPVAVLTTSAVCAAVDRMRDQSPGLSRLRWIATDALDADAPESWQPPALRPDGLAYLQYTSGSTSTPKGVMVTHASLLHNSEHIRTAWGYTPESVAVMWVPNFHDDGLVHGIVQPLYTGYRCVLMAPMSVAQRPVHWLRTITRFRGTHSGGPDFAYALCVRKVMPEHRAELDLSSWMVAYNAAEPIRRETLTRFHEAFRSCGFRWEAFYPSFGLAEATLLATTRRCSQAPAFCALDASALELRHRVVEAPPAAEGGRVIVGCGHPPEEREVVIADPETHRPCAPDEVGEVWISSPSVASGYWNRPEESERTFGARLADGNGPFLRTGDLGFLRGGELFVTGRLKDLIILHGRNIYPQDVELTVEKSHPALRAGCGAAFSIEAGGEERLVVVHEAGPGSDADLDRIVDEIRQAVAEEHELPLHAVVLLRPRTLAKTSSGKVQRQSCRRAFLEGSLEAVRQWTAPVAASPSAGAARRRADELIEWLRGPGAERINSRLMDERRSIPPHVVLELGNRGAFGLLVPEAYGGLGLGYGDAVRVFEQLAAIDLTLASFVSGHNSLGVLPILRHGREELRRELLPRLASGRELAAFALTEPEAGSNPRAMTSRAEAEGQGSWRLHGTKVWSGTAAWAGAINVFVQHPEFAQAGGVSGFVLRPPSPGLRLGPEALTLGLRGMVQSPVLLEGVTADEGSMLGRPGEGMEAAQDAMMSARLLLGAIAVGGMKRCAQLMLRYASRRAIATGSLLENPVSLARLSSLTAAISALEGLVRRTAALLDAGGPAPVDALLCCKIAGSELLWRAADDLMQLLGGRGYVETNVAPQILRDARILRIVEGPTETLRMFLGTRAWYEGGELHELLTSVLGAPEISARLREALQAVNARCTGSGSPFAHRASGLRWAYVLGGEITVAAVLWAAAKERPDAAAEWARASFEQTVARCLAASPEETALLSAGEIRLTVAAYEGDVGDVEPSAADEERNLDPLLRRSGAVAAAAPLPATVPERPAPGPLRGAESISAWLCERIARQIGVAVEEIDPRKPFAYQGLDSVTSVMLLQELGEWLRKPLSPTLAWAHPTVDLLSRHLAVQCFPSVSVEK